MDTDDEGLGPNKGMKPVLSPEAQAAENLNKRSNAKLGNGKDDKQHADSDEDDAAFKEAHKKNKRR